MSSPRARSRRDRSQPGTQFHILSFEGPDPYSRAGGIASRVTGLAESLATRDETHLWFIGDPDLPGHERTRGLWLHRWCQWISQYHREGVYAGEDGKHSEFSATLPGFLLQEHLLPALKTGSVGVVLAEEWQTANAVLHLDWLLRQAGMRHRVEILWNANNTFGFDWLDWNRLSAAATITTVSRFMRQEIWKRGVDSLVIPNGISNDALEPPDERCITALRGRVDGRLLLTKIARWDPDKRWLLAVETVTELKARGWRPLLVARGGSEGHGAEVLSLAAARGLRVADRVPEKLDGPALVDCFSDLEGVDVVNIRRPLNAEMNRILFGGSAAVLANSGREPFGLVGLESMAAGGITCVGGTGEDYAMPGWNALMLVKDDPREFLTQFEPLAQNPREANALRKRAVSTARHYLWQAVLRRNLLPRLRQLHATAP
jgi:glycosyltransferase involved in cell wall biosynthesis